mmetsp:Transcript_92672/g.299773  ORF Transcript_92672/g.299773 Transcript_92672/m.299773 type:complete len:463 (+) Transcript_92672:374-1762(+)
MSQCTPTRASIMTGRYPIRYGLQNKVPPDDSDYGLALDETILPQRLQSHGFRTHAVGKWHLGLIHPEYTPTYRGFESFLGFYTGMQDYFTHEDLGFDFRNDTRPNCGAGCSEVLRQAAGTYSTNVFAAEAERVVANHDKQQPLFLYFAFQAVHAPDEVPESYRRPYRGLFGIGQEAEQREIYAGMLSALDEGVANLTRALDARGMLEDTLIAFTTDNGGPVTDEQCARGKCNKGQGSNNWPRRGGKHSMWEGGVRGPAFVSYRKEIPPGRWGGLMHSVDWLPSILEAAGSSARAKTGFELDGASMWKAWLGHGPSPRTDLLLNIDSFRDGLDEQIPSTAGYIRVDGEHQWKLFVGQPGPPDLWKAPPELNVSSRGQGVPYVTCDPFCLFDVAKDPREEHDLAADATVAAVARALLEEVKKYNESAVPALFPGHRQTCMLVDGVLTPCVEASLLAAPGVELTV